MPEPTAVGVIETDSFCAGCGFNLHSQKVWLDERLGLAVCRCPECGKHAVAGMKTTATSQWLRRLALVGSIAWGLCAVGFVIGMFGFGVAIHAAADSGLTYRTFETVSGRAVELSNSNGAPLYMIPGGPGKGPTTAPGEQVVLRRKLAPWLHGRPMRDADTALYSRPSSFSDAAVGGGLLMLGWYLCSALIAAGCWFWRPWRRWLWLLLPTLSAITVLILMMNQNDAGYWNSSVRFESDVPLSLFIGAIWLGNVIVMAIGLATGRPFARLLLTVFIPPKPRQLFAFLWHCDGKTMPVGENASELAARRIAT